MYVTVSFYEIYCAKIYDLLNEKALLPVREDNKKNINVVGLCDKRIENVK